jgi:nicotinate-nucleotide adenylyltransferase
MARSESGLPRLLLDNRTGRIEICPSIYLDATARSRPAGVAPLTPAAVPRYLDDDQTTAQGEFGMRVGIFGGTFDPVHLGHLILAEQARDQAQLDEVWFVPAPRPPQKEAQAITRFEQRVEMLSLALAGNPAFRIDEIEKDRVGPSYTVDTLAVLRRRNPQHVFFLLIGGDSLVDLPAWREPRRIIEQAGLVVMDRPGSPTLDAGELRRRLALSVDDALGLIHVKAPAIDIASRYLRQQIADGRSVRYLVPRSVEMYIQEKKLYQGG